MPELGQLCLVLALCATLGQSVFGRAGAQRRDAAWMAMVKPAAMAQLAFLALAFLLLVSALLRDDFSVRYVAINSNTAMPLIYKVAAAWGAHEGSMLLWICILSVWGIAVAVLSRQLPQQFVARVLGVMGLIGVGFLLFELFTSNPFLRLFPTQGRISIRSCRIQRWPAIHRCSTWATSACRWCLPSPSPRCSAAA